MWFKNLLNITHVIKNHWNIIHVVKNYLRPLNGYIGFLRDQKVILIIRCRNERGCVLVNLAWLGLVFSGQWMDGPSITRFRP